MMYGVGWNEFGPSSHRNLYSTAKTSSSCIIIVIIHHHHHQCYHSPSSLLSIPSSSTIHHASSPSPTTKKHQTYHGKKKNSQHNKTPTSTRPYFCEPTQTLSDTFVLHKHSENQQTWIKSLQLRVGCTDFNELHRTTFIARVEIYAYEDLALETLQ